MEAVEVKSEDAPLVSGNSSNQQFIQWLNITVGLPQYLNNFTQNGFSSLNSIKLISNKQDLSEIGIKLLGHQRKILSEIGKLKHTDSNIDMHVVPVTTNSDTTIADFGSNKQKNKYIPLSGITESKDSEHNKKKNKTLIILLSVSVTILIVMGLGFTLANMGSSSTLLKPSNPTDPTNPTNSTTNPTSPPSSTSKALFHGSYYKQWDDDTSFYIYKLAISPDEWYCTSYNEICFYWDDHSDEVRICVKEWFRKAGSAQYIEEVDLDKFNENECVKVYYSYRYLSGYGEGEYKNRYLCYADDTLSGDDLETIYRYNRPSWYQNENPTLTNSVNCPDR